MSRRDAASRPRPSFDPRHARSATVSATAALLVLAPLTSGAAKFEPVASPAAGVVRPAGHTTIASGDAVLWGTSGLVTAGRGTLPWFSFAHRAAALPTTVGAMFGVVTPGGADIPEPVRNAYTAAESSVAATHPGCRLPWWLLAGVGYVESGHAAGGNVDATGRTTGDIYGPVLDGTTPDTAVVPDSDQGTLDGDRAHDRAVGPMQFLPSTWRSFGTDGNGDGTADPHNIQDAALSAAHYLCSGGGDLSDQTAARTAILRYNPSDEYVTNVLAVGHAYRDGRTPPPPWRPPLTPSGSAPPVITAEAPTWLPPQEAPPVNAGPAVVAGGPAPVEAHLAPRPPASRPVQAPPAPRPTPASRPSRSAGPYAATDAPTDTETTTTGPSPSSSTASDRPSPGTSSTTVSPSPGTSSTTDSPSPGTSSTTVSPSPGTTVTCPPEVLTPSPTSTSTDPAATPATGTTPTTPTAPPTTSITTGPSPTAVPSPSDTPSPTCTIGPDGKPTPVPSESAGPPDGSTASATSPAPATTSAVPTPVATPSGGATTG